MYKNMTYLLTDTRTRVERLAKKGVKNCALSKDDRRNRRLELMQVAADLCRSPDEGHQSPPERHSWVASERARLGIDAAVGDWNDRPLLYHLKARPHRFLRTMALLSP